MKRYDEKVLNSLLDKYENSLLYTGQNQRKQSIAFPVKKSTLPEYFDETSMQFEVVHAQLTDMEEKGFVRLIWRKGKEGHILEKCLLQIERAEEIYAWLQRRTRKQKEEDVIHICREYRGRHPALDAFLQYVEQRIGQGQSVAQYVDMDHPQAMAERCGLILLILENRTEIFLREFSVRFLKDSKAAEKEIAGAAGCLRCPIRRSADKMQKSCRIAVFILLRCRAESVCPARISVTYVGMSAVRSVKS